MKKIRYKTFETNSSSVHTLQYSDEVMDVIASGLEPCNIPMNEEGKLVVDFGKCDKSGDFHDQYDKLSYLITCLYYSAGMDFQTSYQFECLKEAVMKHEPSCTGIYVPFRHEAYIDHQSIPDYRDEFNGMCNIYDEDSVINFVFNKNMYLHCDSD